MRCQPEGFGDLAVRGINQNRVVDENQDRELIGIDSVLTQKALPFCRVRGVKPKRYGIARAQATKFVAAAIPLGTDHPHPLEQWTVGPPPVGQGLTELWVELFLGRTPGLLHESVNLAECQRSVQRLGRRLIAEGREQNALRPGVALARLREEGDPACSRQPEVGNDHGHVCRLVMESPECSQGSSGRCRRADAIVGAETSSERGGQCAAQHGIGIRNEEDRLFVASR